MVTNSTSHYDGKEAYFQPLVDELTRLLLQIIIVVVLASAISRLLSYIKQPGVVSEIITGIVLGPTACGYIPGFTDAIFPEYSLETFGAVAELGLIFFMFIIGLEIDLTLLRNNFKNALFISATGVITPFGVGMLLALYLVSQGYMPDGATTYHFYLFIGVAVCITALPVLARIISERKLLNTNLGLLILASAAVDDAFAWIILALVIALVRAGSPLNALWVLLTMLGYLIFVAVAIRPLVAKICEYGVNNQRVFVVLLLMVLGSAWFTSATGVHAIFGAFVFGIIIPRKNNISHDLTHKIEDIVVSLLLPMYFVKSGLNTQLGLLKSGSDWGACFLVIVGASLGKIIPGIITARIVGLNWKECAVVGFLRNAKGLVELIVLNIGLDLGVISPQVFGMLVLMAVLTTMSATPFMYLVYPPRHIRVDQMLPQGDQAPLLIALQENQNHDFEMFAVASVVKDRKKPAYVLRLREVNELPSSFMPYVDPITEVDEHGLSKTTRLQAELLDLDLRMASVATPWYSNPGQELLEVAVARHSRMVLIHQEPSEFDEFDLSMFSRHIVEKVLSESATHVGIVLNHSDHELRVESNPLQTVFVPYGGHPNDAEILRLIATMARQKNLTVTVMYPLCISPVKLDALYLLQAARGLKLVPCEKDENFETAAIQYCSENQFDLCVVGTSPERTESDEQASETSVRVSVFAPSCGSVLVLIVFQVPEEQFQQRLSKESPIVPRSRKANLSMTPVPSGSNLRNNGGAEERTTNINDLTDLTTVSVDTNTPPTSMNLAQGIPNSPLLTSTTLAPITTPVGVGMGPPLTPPTQRGISVAAITPFSQPTPPRPSPLSMGSTLNPISSLNSDMEITEISAPISISSQSRDRASSLPPPLIIGGAGGSAAGAAGAGVLSLSSGDSDRDRAHIETIV